MKAASLMRYRLRVAKRGECLLIRISAGDYDVRYELETIPMMQAG